MLRFGTLLLSLLFVSACHGAPPPPQQADTASGSHTRSKKHSSGSGGGGAAAAAGSASTGKKFDFYVLSLSWSPEYCASRGNSRPGDIQCAEERPYDFVLHGLWPQYEQGWPQDCSTEPIARPVVDGMLDIMPSPGLIRHEWTKHGTCSGLDPAGYFGEARKAFQAVRIPEPYKRPQRQVVSNVQELKKRFVQANPRLKEDGVAAVCSGRFLQEVRVCLTTDFQPRACSKDVLRSQCRVDEVILRPVR